ncbi:MAG: hypothetical protein MUC87_17125 [Bacteroidia bacterium]|jgi:O-antigen/teichoic acid export membrane protein|nr:hypothetical protein [Bacteroidia bacterium]
MIRNILVNFSARMAVAVANFIVLLCTTHELGADVRGKISLIQLGVQLIHLISDLAGGPSVVYLVPRSPLRMLVVTATGWAVFSAVAVGGVLLYFGQIPEAYGRDVLGIGLLVSLSAVFQNILLGQERIRAYNVLLLLQGALLIGGVVFSLYAAGVHSEMVFVIGSYVSWGVVAVAAAWLVLRHTHKVTRYEGRPLLWVMFVNGFFTQAASLTHQLSIRENYFRLEKLSSTNDAAVGIYSTALSLGEAILLFSASVASILMARAANVSDSPEVRRNAMRLSKLSILITLPALLFFALLPDAFYTWLLGKDFSPVRGAFLSLLPGIAAMSFGTVYAHYFSGTGKHYCNFMAGCAGLGIALLSSGPLINAFGVQGAGWSASMAYGGLSLLIFVMFLAGSKVKGEWKNLLPQREDVREIKALVKKIKG